MEEKKEPSKKVKCLMLSETKDMIKFGSSDIGSKGHVITINFTEEGFKKCNDFRFLNEFVLHFYMADNFDPEFITGVNRYDKCIIVGYDESRCVVKIRAWNKKFYNNSELKLLRKDKIGNLLFEDEGN